jgi:tRNA pseudouridine32 synthase/23S rRNA pseudouridine746 synthase
MAGAVSYFYPQPGASELPARLPSPFSAGAPHPLARRAADALEAGLKRGEPISAALFDGVRCGKMFGVLVVAEAGGRVGYLRGFSGMVAGSWDVEGFVGPLFDQGLRDAVWPGGQAELAAYERQLEELAAEPRAAAAKAALAGLHATQAATLAALAAVHEQRRRQRDEERDRVERSGGSPEQRRTALQALGWESRDDTLAERRQRKEHRLQREPFARVVRERDQQRTLVKRRQSALSSQLREELWAGYAIDSARGQRRTLRELFAPATPPGGAADCAAPKLFGQALRDQLRPLALAEFWVGTPSSAAGRHSGVYHPACERKCGPILTHMLDGLAVAPAVPA